MRYGLAMRIASWNSVLLLILMVAIASFVLGLYFGPMARKRPAVRQTPNLFFTDFDPKQYLEAATAGELTWTVVEDKPVMGEVYGNPPFSRQYPRRKARLVATITPEEWHKLKTGWLRNIFFNQSEKVQRHWKNPGVGRFNYWPIDSDAEYNDTAL